MQKAAYRQAIAEPRQLSVGEAAWLAGLFEGEGTICIARGRFVKLQIGIADRDVVERIDALFPMRNGPRLKTWKGKPQHKNQYIWYANRRPVVETALRAMLPWFGNRRRARALEALEVLEKHHPGSHGHWQRAKTHCPQGHPYDEKNTYHKRSTGARGCRICRRESSRRAEARKRVTGATAHVAS